MHTVNRMALRLEAMGGGTSCRREPARRGAAEPLITSSALRRWPVLADRGEARGVLPAVGGGESVGALAACLKRRADLGGGGGDHPLGERAVPLQRRARGARRQPDTPATR
eukprot:1067508-Prymnesium_polylepis.1